MARRLLRSSARARFDRPSLSAILSCSAFRCVCVHPSLFLYHVRASRVLLACTLQYQVRLHHHGVEGSSLIYAPRDDDAYIRPSGSLAFSTVASSRRLSEERRLLKMLQAILNNGSDDKKQMMYDNLRKRHKQAMKRIINDVTIGLAIPTA